MESMRSTWTDSRLDDFAAATAGRFDRLEQRMDAGFRELGAEIGGVRDEIGGVRKDVKDVHKDILSLQRTIIGAGGAMFAALLGVIATQL